LARLDEIGGGLVFVSVQQAMMEFQAVVDAALSSAPALTAHMALAQAPEAGLRALRSLPALVHRKLLELAAGPQLVIPLAHCATFRLPFFLTHGAMKCLRSLVPRSAVGGLLVLHVRRGNALHDFQRFGLKFRFLQHPQPKIPDTFLLPLLKDPPPIVGNHLLGQFLLQSDIQHSILQLSVLSSFF
jgi:hypothetical protein